MSFARLGRRTLLVDADLRRPRLGRYLLAADDQDSPGLVGVLDGHADLRDAVRPTGVNNLDLLPCGPVPEHPAELLDSAEFDDLLAALADRYDKVVIDSPPVLPVTDARVLSRACDATVLVVRVGASTRRAARQAAEGLERVGGHLLGVVANDVRTGRRGGRGYAYGYGLEPFAEAAPAATVAEPPHANNGASGANGANGRLPAD